MPYDPNNPFDQDPWEPPVDPVAPAPEDPLARRRRGIAGAYQQYLGRDIRDNEYGYWLGNDDFERQIAASPEAQQRSGVLREYPNVQNQIRQDFPGPFGPQAQAGGAYANIPGFDFTKLSNQGYVNEKYSPAVRLFSRAIAATGMDPRTARGNLQGLVNWINANGGTARVVGDDRIDFGDGRGPIDVLTSGGSWWFNNLPGGGGDGVQRPGILGGGHGGGPPFADPAALLGGHGGGGGVPSVGPAGGQGALLGGGGGVQGQDFQNQVRQMLLQQLQQLSQPVTADDPSIQGEMSAQSRLLERERVARRQAAAERAGAQGLLLGGQSSGAFEAEVASGFEDKGERLSGLQSQLFARELSSRRGQLAGLLQMAVQTGDNESARALQMQIALMDAELRKLGIQTQAGLGYAGLGLQRDLGFAGLNQQQGIWNDRYGLDREWLLYQMNRDAARARGGYQF